MVAHVSIYLSCFQQRSNWHDVLGMHCPKFGEDRLVALPIPKPIDFENKDEYKIQLSFDSNRITTPWLRIIGNKAQDAPYLEIELIRSGDAVIGVSTKVNSVPKSDPKYREIEEEFKDPNRWPKHLLVQYSWQSKHEVDSGRGLSVILSVGLVWSLFVILTAWIKHRKQINKFLRDIDESQGSMAGSGLDAHKAE